MGIIKCASGASCWRGLDYYKENKIKDIKKINEKEYTSKVCGTEEYNVYLNLVKPRSSTCNCALADGKKIICKHIVATYFSVVPGSSKEFEEEQKRLENEYYDYRERQYENAVLFINNMSQTELINELIYILNYAPEWVYDDFVRKNDIRG